MRDQKYMKDSRCTNWHDWLRINKREELYVCMVEKYMKDSRLTNARALLERNKAGGIAIN